jgi:hypothetical protein
VGTGSPQEAEYTLNADIIAGEWHFVGDGIIVQPVDVTFDIFVRKAAGGEIMLATFTQHFDPLPVGFEAQPFERRFEGVAIDQEPGDQLIFRYSGSNTTVPMAYVPNGDGFRANGRIPFVDPPE